MLGALGTTDCPLTNKYPLLGTLQGIQLYHTIPSLNACTSSCLQNQYMVKLRSVCQHKVQPWPLLEYNFWSLQGNRRFYISDAYLCLYIFYFNVSSYVQVFCLHVCALLLCLMLYWAADASNPPELELQMVVSQWLSVLGIEPGCFEKKVAAKYLLASS